MNKRIRELLAQTDIKLVMTEFSGCLKGQDYLVTDRNLTEMQLKQFAKLIVEATLDQVKERAYYTGDRDWSDEVDRPWIQLEFGYGSLAEAKK